MRWLVAIAALLSALSAPCAAVAAPGDITYLGCIAQTNGTDCTLMPADTPALHYPVQIAIAPGGVDAYAVQSAELAPMDAVVHMRRGADGRLTFADCIADADGVGCATLPSGSTAMSGAERLAITPDGRDIYVTAYYGNAIAHFRRNAAGTVAYAGCLGAPASGCTQPPGLYLRNWNPVDVAVSPDGKSVYAIADDDPALVNLNRAADGTLSLGNCFGSVSGCEQRPYTCDETPPCRWTDGVTVAKSLAVSDDGRAIYVASHYNASRSTPSAIAHFVRDARGVHYADCVGAARLCSPLPAGASITGVRSIAVAPGSRHVYVTGKSDGDPRETAITHFRARADGALEFADCIGTGANNCTRPPGGTLGASAERGIAVGPDARDLYAGHLTSLTLDANGAMAIAKCFGEGFWCESAWMSGHNRQTGVAVDGRNVYAASEAALHTLARGSSTPLPSGPAPTIKVDPPINVTWHSADLVGYVNGHGKVAHYQWDLGRTTNYELPDGGGGSEVREDKLAYATGSRSGLRPGTTYHYRLRARYGSAVVTSPDATFTTASINWTPDPPNVRYVAAYGLGPTYVTLDGVVSTQSVDTTFRFEYGPTSSYGQSVAATAEQEHRYSEELRVSAQLNGLERGRVYHFRLVATNSAGTTRSADQTFPTLTYSSIPTAPALGQPDAIDVTAGAATLRAPLNPRSSATRWRFEYGDSWARTADATLPGDGNDHIVTARVTGLSASTSYPFRLVAEGPSGIVVGREARFTTAPVGGPAPSPPPAPPPEQPPPPGQQGTAPAQEPVISTPVGAVPLPGSTTPATGGGATSPASPLRLALSASSQRLDRVLRSGVAVTMRSSRACRVSVDMIPLGISPGRARARRKSWALTGPEQRLRIRLPLGMRIALAGMRRPAVRVLVRGVAADGATATDAVRIRLPISFVAAARS
jgi:hypothetical protein